MVNIPPESDEQTASRLSKKHTSKQVQSKAERYNVGLQKEIMNNERKKGTAGLHLASRFVVLVMWHMFVHRDKAKVWRDWLFKTDQ